MCAGGGKGVVRENYYGENIWGVNVVVGWC